MPCKNEVASVHRRKDEGKKDDRCYERHRASSSGARIAVTERAGALADEAGQPAKKAPRRSVKPKV